MNFLQIIGAINAILPAISGVVSAVETLVPQGSNGAAKLSAASAILQGAMKAAGGIEADIAALVSPIENAISAVVALKNATGTMPGTVVIPPASQSPTTAA